ncbi:MAG: PorV/PorQ family protein [bacterium]
MLNIYMQNERISINFRFIMLIALIFNLSGLFPAMLNATLAESGAKSLLLTGSARESSLGDACVALNDSINILNYNPAGVAQLKDMELSFQHSSWLIDTKYEYFAFSKQLTSCVIAASIMYMDYGSFTRRNMLGIETGSFSSKDLILDFTYACPVTKRLDAGVRIRYLRQAIAEFSANTFPFDCGILYSFIPDKFTGGVSIQNVGSETGRFNRRREKLPTRLRIGIGLRPVKESLLFSIEHNSVNSSYSFLNIGCEIGIKNTIFLRTGFSSSVEYEDDVVFKGGVGVSIFGYFLDYAYEPFGDLDSCHKFSLRMKF